MGKLEYLDALKRAMTGLAPAVQAKTLAYYEQRFVDGVAAGRSEQAVAAELDDPKKIAMTLRASAHMAAFEQKRNPANFLRMVVAGLGLTIFNLLMVVPAAVYLSLLAALYAMALGFYVIGIAVTASGLAGANELVLNRPFGIVLSDDSDGSERNAQTHISISEQGIRVFNDKPASKAGRAADNAVALGRQAARAARESARAGVAAAAAAQKAAADAAEAGNAADRAAEQARAAGVEAAAAGVAAAEAAERALADADAGVDTNSDADGARPSQVIKRAEQVAGRAIRITTDVDAASRTTQTAFGLAMVIGAILLFLLDLVVSKYTLLGVKRYFQMNLSLLKG